jgi:ornithine cyclodeaminase/alanine dehydrogenase
MSRKILYLTRADVEQAGVTMARIIETIENAFREKGMGNVELPPKPGVHSRPDAFIHAMPAYVAGMKAIGMKWVSGYPDNPSRGLPYISGLIVINDVETGLPLSVMDCVWITAQRTAAASAVAAKYLAREDAQTLGILGAGVQGFSHLEALKELLPINVVVAYDISPDQLHKYKEKALGRWPELDIRFADKPRDAVEGMDIVVTAGPILKIPHATIQPGWFSPGSFATLVDFDSYWHPDAMKEADKFVTDDTTQLDYYRSVGYFQDMPEIHGDIGQLVTGRITGRENAVERTMTCNLGLAMHDVVVGKLVFEIAREHNTGTWLDL